MANTCEITGKKKLKGHRVSHANNKTIHFQQPNIQERRLYVPELGRKVKVNVSTNGLRTLDKVGGLTRFLIKAKPENLSQNLRNVRKLILKKGLA